MEHSIVQTLNECKPHFRNEFDALVGAAHLAMRELGFRCTGLAEQPSSNSNETYDSKPLPEGWNQSADSYSFQYKHTQSSLSFLVKFLVLNDKLLIHAVAKEDNKIASLEISVKDYVNEKSLSNYNEVYKQLDKFLALFKINISSKILPGLNKEGYEAATTETTTTANPNTQREIPPRRDPLEHNFPPHHQPYINDPLRIPGTGNRPLGNFPRFGVGYDDLTPPLPGFGVPFGGGGNLMGPNHPGFGPRVNDPYGAFDPFAPQGPANPPRGRVPGARYDPVGPPQPLNPPRSNINNNNNQGFGDELPPPGFDNGYGNMFL